MANVMAVNQGTKAMDGYAITNDKVCAKLETNATYIKISYLGMQNKEIQVTTAAENI
jgi:hypothetical protein